MTTHTIAMIGDMLAATAPDGDDRLMSDRLNDTLSQLNADDRDSVDVVYTFGLTLYATEDEAEDSGAKIVYSGCEMGWLQDENGNAQYMAAGVA